MGEEGVAEQITERGDTRSWSRTIHNFFFQGKNTKARTLGPFLEESKVNQPKNKTRYGLLSPGGSNLRMIFLEQGQN